ncbi:MAG: cupin domain-containing protein [Acidobacteriaceae bacterium]|nr:cupin domain-containing protein [Acidobacteriaceae bacterium]
MATRSNVTQFPSAIPADDVQRNVVVQNPESNTAQHLGIVGDTYTILLSGKDTAGRFCLIDMHVPPEGGPPPHRHDFEETFVLLEGEVEATVRGEKRLVRAGETINIPANAPHQFHNSSSSAVRMLCLCSPAGQDEFFREVGIPVATRTTPPPKLTDEQQVAFMQKVMQLVPRYRTELLKEA